MRTGRLAIKPLTPARWDDLKRLFETNSVCRGCWCMYWRLRGRDFSGGWGSRNRGAFRRLVKKGPPPVDDKPVWAVPCFFIARGHRGAGLTLKLLRAASAYARKRGARLLEGYPIDTRGKRSADPWVYTGLLSAFEKAGFREVVRRSRSRPIVRRRLYGGRPPQPTE